MSRRSLTGKVIPFPGPTDDLPTEHLPWCYGCGSDNPDGLGVRPRYLDDRVEADLAFAPRFQGGPGLVHGGAIAAFFDDLMGFVPIGHRTPAVTAQLETNFLRPIPLGETVHGAAWLADRDGRKLYVEAEATDDDGRPYVEAFGLFIEVPLSHFTERHPYEPERYYP